MKASCPPNKKPGEQAGLFSTLQIQVTSQQMRVTSRQIEVTSPLNTGDLRVIAGGNLLHQGGVKNPLTMTSGDFDLLTPLQDHNLPIRHAANHGRH